MQDRSPFAHYSGVLSEAMRERAAANVPASEAVALNECLKTLRSALDRCRRWQMVMEPRALSAALYYFQLVVR